MVVGLLNAKLLCCGDDNMRDVIEVDRENEESLEHRVESDAAVPCFFVHLEERDWFGEAGLALKDELAVVRYARVDDVSPFVSEELLFLREIDLFRGDNESAFWCCSLESDTSRQGIGSDVFRTNEGCEQIQWDDGVPASELIAEVQAFEGELSVSGGD